MSKFVYFLQAYKHDIPTLSQGGVIVIPYPNDYKPLSHIM